MRTRGSLTSMASNSSSTRACSAALPTRMSTPAVACPATTLMAEPPLISPVLIVVPWSGAATFAAATTNSDSAVIALAPSCGASPACDATPVAVTWKIPVPLRAVFTGTATATPPAKPLSEAERGVVAQLLRDGGASAASIARTADLATSTAHRVVRRVLDEGRVRPRLEIVSEWLGFQTAFILRLRVAPGATPEVMRRTDQLPRTRLAAHVAGDMSVLATGLVTDRAALALLVDNEPARIPGLLGVSVAVMLAEPRRYWLDRDLTTGLGTFHAPTLL